jgi:hypothetical protein
MVYDDFDDDPETGRIDAVNEIPSEAQRGELAAPIIEWVRKDPGTGRVLLLQSPSSWSCGGGNTSKPPGIRGKRE